MSIEASGNVTGNVVTVTDGTTELTLTLTEVADPTYTGEKALRVARSGGGGTVDIPFGAWDELKAAGDKVVSE